MRNLEHVRDVAGSSNLSTSKNLKRKWSTVADIELGVGAEQ
jgi:hypothetical protein